MNRDRFHELLEKRRALLSNIYEEEELIAMANEMPPDELVDIDPELFTYSHHKRLDDIMTKLDELEKRLNLHADAID